jgi:hypothetical protein
MEPDAALSIASQIAVALAGFAGVVTAFRAQSVHEWEAIDKFRLRLLLTNSILPLAYCLFALALLTINPVPFHFWRWCSGVSVATNIGFAAGLSKDLKTFRQVQLRAAPANRVAFYFFIVLGAISLLLQLYNIVRLNVFWPFFLGITVQLLAAMFQFMLMILRPSRNEQ